MMGHGVSGLLIAAAAGYWVLTQSAHQRENVKKLGQLLGIVIIAVSVAGAACKLYYITTGKSMGGVFCPSGKACPFMGKAAPSESR